MIREPYNLNPYNSTIDTSKVNNFSFTFSGDELGSWNIEIAKNNTSPEIVYTSEEFVPEDVGYSHIYDGDIVEGITLPSTIAHSQGDDGLLRRLYSINGYPFDEAVVKLNVNGIENIGNIKGSTANGYLVATNYSLGRTGDGVAIIGFDKDGTIIGSQVADGTYDFLGYLLSVKTNSNIQVGQVVQIEGNSFIIGSIEDVGDGYSELTIVNGEVTFSDTASIVSFDSLAEADVTELTVGIEPVQDLNGYDAPWVGGAGVNKADWANNSSGIGTSITKTATGFDMSPMSSGQNPQVPTLLFPWSDADTAITVSFYAWATVASAVLRFDGQPDSVHTSGTAFVDKTISLTTTRTRYSYSGAILAGTTGFRWFRLNSDTGATTATIHVENIQLEFSSTATAWQPYSNICPITGHDEVTVTRTGKNLCAPRDVDSNIYNAGHLIPVTQGETIYVYGEWTWKVSGNLYGRVFDDKDATNKNADGANPSPNYFNSDTVFSMTMPRSGYFGICYSASVASYTVDKMMVSRVPITSYEPYRSNTYTTSLGQTVYGGTLDVVSGVLTVDKAMVDLGSLNWGRYNEIQTAYVYLASLVSQGMDTSSAKLLSSVFKCRDSWTSLTNLANGEMQSHPSLAYAYARCDSYTTASDFKTAVTGQQLVFELATPVEYQLTAQQIKTLVGTNNVWASSGDIVNIKFKYNIN